MPAIDTLAVFAVAVVVFATATGGAYLTLGVATASTGDRPARPATG